MTDVIFFGASKLGAIAYDLYQKKINILFFSDNDKEKWGTKHCGKLVISLDRLLEVIKNNPGISIIITSHHYEEIYSQLSEQEVENLFVFCMNAKIESFYQKKGNILKSEIFNTKRGIKGNNQLISSANFNYFRGERFFLPINQLKLGLDGLKDTYSSAGKSVQNSPHTSLMKCLHTGSDLTDSDYIKRVKSGTLDFRNSSLITDEFLKFTEKRYEERLLQIELEEIKPIRVGKVQDDWYIIDGKHRAALKWLLGYKEIEVINSPEILYDSYLLWIYELMKENEKEYKKNIYIYEQLLLKDNEKRNFNV